MTRALALLAMVTAALASAGCAGLAGPGGQPDASVDVRAETFTAPDDRSPDDRSPGPLTRAEASAFRETSTHADVLAFLAALPPDTRRHHTTFGTTPEGRALPLVVWGAGDASPEAVLAAPPRPAAAPAPATLAAPPATPAPTPPETAALDAAPVPVAWTSLDRL